MQFPVTIAGFEKHKIVLEAGRFGRQPKLTLDGKKTAIGKNSREFILPRREQSETRVRLRDANWLDPIPQLVCEGKTYRVVKPWSWYDGLWIFLPLLIMAAVILLARMVSGWLIGLLAGGLAAWLSTRLFRSSLKEAVNYGVTGLVTLFGLLVFFGLAYGFNLPANSFYIREPKEFRANDLGFSITTPVHFKGSIASADTNSGKTTVYTFTPDTAGVSYRMVVIDFPQGALGQTDPQKAFDQFRETTLKERSGQLLLDDRTPLVLGVNSSTPPKTDSGSQDTSSGYPNQVLVVNFQNNGQTATFWARTVIVGDRRYQIVVIVPESEANNTQAGRFINSFTIISK